MPTQHSSDRPQPTLLTAAELTDLIDKHFPNVHEGSGRIVIASVGQNAATLRMLADPNMIRPGGTVSGPSMFKLADLAVYVAILAKPGGGRSRRRRAHPQIRPPPRRRRRHHALRRRSGDRRPCDRHVCAAGPVMR
jgi:hypothetical protein